MKGFPKHLNSKQDYVFVKTNFPAEQWKPCWQALLDQSKNWFYTSTLAAAADGVTDDTHKVVTATDMDNKIIYMQYELRTDPSSDMLKLGFTEQEINDALGGEKNG